MDQPHNVVIEDCKKITATAIDSVDGFSSSQIVLTYKGGKIVVAGSGLKIVNFSKANGNFAAVGTVSGVKYTAKNTGIRQKLFK